MKLPKGNIKKHLTIRPCSVWLGVFLLLICQYANAQIKFKNTLLPDGQTYQISIVSNTTYIGINALISSSQVTIVVPHGVGSNYFEFTGPSSPIPNMKWTFTGRVDEPVEDPDKDYLFFNFINNNSPIVRFDMNANVEIPIFTIKRTSNCIGKVYVFDNQYDPFVSPNSKGINAGNNIAVLGAGGEAYSGNTELLPSVSILTPTNEICAGKEVLFRASPNIPGNYEYQWFVDEKPQGLANSSTDFRYQSPDSESDFLRKISVKIIRKGTNLCDVYTSRSHSELIVNGKAKPEIIYGGYNCIVLPTTIKVNALAGSDITWLRNGQDILGQKQNAYAVNESGEYVVKITRNGCVSESAPIEIIGVDTEEKLMVFAGNDTTITAGEEITLIGESQGAVTFAWSPQLLVSDINAAKTKTSPEETTEYTLTVTSASGCPFSDKVKITVIHGLYIPSAFSPNSDGVNDEWEIKNLEIYPQNSIAIYNRWGKLIYSTRNSTSSWNGQIAGTTVESGTYSYIIKTTNKVYRGSLEVLK